MWYFSTFLSIFLSLQSISDLVLCNHCSIPLESICLNCWKDLDAGARKAKGEGRRQRMRRLDCITDSMDTSFSKPQNIVEDTGDWPVVVHEVAKSSTWLSNWTTTILFVSVFVLWNEQWTFLLFIFYWLVYLFIWLHWILAVHMGSSILTRDGAQAPVALGDKALALGPPRKFQILSSGNLSFHK